jgi:hypothetical protein
MAIYGTQELLDRGGEAVGEAATGVYTVWRAGKILTGSAGGAVGLSFAAGGMLGDWIKENVTIEGKTVEDHVTDFWFNYTYGIWADNQLERNTSDEAFERQRQKLRQQQFSSMRSANEQAAANRAAMAGQQSPHDDAAAMNEIMLQLLPAAIAVSQQRPVQPPLPAQSTGASAIPEQPRCSSDGRRVGTNEWGPTYCWPTTTGAVSVPTGRAVGDSPTLGSTFGSATQPPVNPPKSGTRPACSPFDRWWMGKEWDKRCK